jgi:predicted O-methyltransferase YrrM
MGAGTRLKKVANSLLNRFNVRIDSCTAERMEEKRLAQLERRGHFDRPIFPVLPQFRVYDPTPIFDQVARDAQCFAAISSGANAFSLKNDYFTTPDAEVLYAVVQLYRPAKIVEIGSGNSTQLFRKAIIEAGLNSHLTSIDPEPRRDIAKYADEIKRYRVEDLCDFEFAERLGGNDIVFIDSSHQVALGNDVNWLVLNILPTLASGVLVHFHDIFLPYEYPRKVDHRWNWTEQYLVQAFLTGNEPYDVLWAGHYLQQTYPQFESHFEQWNKSTATSLWLQKK